MQHLTPERISALADSPATLAERSHLNECVVCVAELAAAQRLIQMALTDIPAIERPVTSWERLSPALASEGLISTPILSDAPDFGVVPLRPARASRYRWAMQAAAAAFLLLGGAIVGRASAALPLGGLANADSGQASDTNFQSTAEAMNVMQHASNDFQRAVAYLAVNDSNVTMRGRDAAELYSNRLDALDKTVAATRAALYRAPHDPVLNNYYMQSVGARDLTLRQLGQAVPASLTKRTKF
jgi:hypothetical protein